VAERTALELHVGDGHLSRQVISFGDRDVIDQAPRCDLLDDLAGQRQIDATLREFVGADPNPADEGTRYRLPDGRQNLEGEAYTVVEGASVLIPAEVQRRRQKLGDQITVTCMQLRAVEARPLCAPGGGGECLHRHRNLRDTQRVGDVPAHEGSLR
jgi:hypothetical protein